MQMELHTPGDGFYSGTRFDYGGVFRSLLYEDTEFCGPWFERYDPRMHDAVLGPAEEFSLMVLPGPQGQERWLKPGVGLLRPDGFPYDRFKLYEIVDPGVWTVGKGGAALRFEHTLDACYHYVKEVVETGANSFEIRHSLHAFTDLDGDVYNHNFFTMGKVETGPSRQIDFPFRPEGSWRSAYDSVAFTQGGIRFSRKLRPGESVYSGDIHAAGQQGMPYSMTLREGRRSVHMRGSIPAFKTVFWANHRIACLEPYIRLAVPAGQSFCWTLAYTLL